VIRLAIIGAGDLGQLIAHHAPNCGPYRVAGFYDDFAKSGSVIKEWEVLGSLSEIESGFKSGAFDQLMVAIGYNHMRFRKETFDRFLPVIPFARLIHQNAYVDSSVKVGAGCFVLPGCTVDAHAVLGDNVLLNTGSVIAHDTTVGSHTFCAPAVAVAGKTTIGNCCIIGLNSTVIDNLTICDFTRIAAGAVVNQSITIAGMYAGVPAVLKKRFE
jgi:sugar O-acyltransferase (sialic acid O-acetyltransferase NeuD family)